ncbi:MAG: dihydroorotase [Oscillospiraceae bacterium]
MQTLFKNAAIYRDGMFSKLDVAVRDGIIARVGADIPVMGFDRVLHFDDKLIVSGFADVHTHLREPGFFYKESIASGTRAAAHGGFTAVCTMPNLDPVPDCAKNLRVQSDIIERDACVRVYPYGAITKNREGIELSDFEELRGEVVALTDDGSGVENSALMQEAMEHARELDMMIVAHCEDMDLRAGGYIHAGVYARTHGHKGIPSASEYSQIERDLELVAKTGCRYHVCHLSAAESVEAIREAKRAGLPVSCETAPHYLTLCDSELFDDGRFKMNPPIRSSDDRLALLDGVRDGTIDLIATDHAPHSEAEKSGGLRDSAMGIVGLETAFSVLYTQLVLTGRLSIETLLDRITDAPRRVFRLPGALQEGEMADLVVLDLDSEGAIDSGKFFSKGRSTPFDGMPVKGEVIMTLVGGKTVWQKEQ